MNILYLLRPGKAAMAAAGVALSLFCATTSPAQSMVVQFTFVGIGNDDSGSGAITVSESGPNFMVTGVTGTIYDPSVGAGPFTIQAGGAGLSSYAGSDNLLYWPTTTAIVDFGGISFHSNSGAGPDFNIGGFAQSGPFIYVLNNSIQNPLGYGGGVAGDDTIMLTVTSVPEQSTWILMLLGFASVGFAGHRRKDKSTRAYACD